MIPDWIEAKARACIDPDRARAALSAINDAWPAGFPPLRGVIEEFPAGGDNLVSLLAVSPVSGGKLAKDPAALMWLAQPEVCLAERGPRRMWMDLEREVVSSAFDPRFRGLRKVKGRELLRIALREVAGLSPLEQTTLELSHFAGFCLREVHDAWFSECTRRWGTPESGFAVLGMGKLGGQELDYGSDIEVIFLYGREGEFDSGFTYHEFFTRLAERIIATFSHQDPEGSLFRIDPGLRPQGACGPLVCSLESMETHYSRSGTTWERMALIKARGICGSEELAYEFRRNLQPFIFPHAISPDVRAEIAAVRTRTGRAIAGTQDLKRNVKPGSGGIREIEFIAQTLQLLHGAQHAFLHEPGTLKALHALHHAGILPRETAEALASAYRLLRTVEHRLQIENEAPTSNLPEKPETLGRLAASLGYASTRLFQDALEKHTGIVRAVFDNMPHPGDHAEA